MNHNASFHNLIRLVFSLAVTIILLAQIAPVQSASRNLYVTPIVWSNDGNRLAVTLSEKVEVRSADARQLLYTLSGHSDIITSVAWSLDNSFIATASRDQTIKLWCASDGELLRTLTGQNDYVVFVGWTPDGKSIASSGVDLNPNFIIWDPSVGVPTNKYQTGTVLYGAYSPDGLLFAYIVGGSLDILDSKNYTRKALHRASGCCDNAMLMVRWNLDSSLLISGTGNGLITVWDAATATIRKQFLVNDYAKETVSDVPIADMLLAWVRDVRFDADGKTAWAVAGDGSIKAWKIDTGIVVKQFQLSSLTTATWSPYGARLALLDSSFLSLANGQLSAKQSADTGLEIIIPDPSFEHLNSLAKQCSQEGDKDNPLVKNLATNQIAKTDLVVFIQQLLSLPANAIPPACKADLIALATAVE